MRVIPGIISADKAAFVLEPSLLAARSLALGLLSRP